MSWAQRCGERCRRRSSWCSGVLAYSPPTLSLGADFSGYLMSDLSCHGTWLPTLHPMFQE